jgi:hypothetical protein
MSRSFTHIKGCFKKRQIARKQASQRMRAAPATGSLVLARGPLQRRIFVLMLGQVLCVPSVEGVAIKLTE